MFESIAIRPHAPFQTHVDLGEIAEALLFYGRVHLLLNEQTLTQLVRQAGVDTVLAIVEDGFAEVEVFRNGTATHTTGPIGDQVHDFILIEPMKSKTRHRSRLEIVYESIRRAIGKKKASRKAAYRFLNAASVSDVNAEVPNERGITELARHDVEDTEYVRTSIPAIVEALTGKTLPHGWQFEIIRIEQGLRVEANLNFTAITSRMQELYSTDARVTPALLLDFFNTARFDFFHSARLESELLTSDISGTLIRNRLMRAINASQINRLEEIEAFQNIVLEGRSVGEAVRSGHKSLDQVLRLAEKARRFRSWLHNQPPTSELLREYYASVVYKSWIDRLPSKHLRFLFFTATGIGIDAIAPTGLATGLGTALGAVDAYVVDRVARGWQPNQFVDRELRSFLKSK